jgi:hypothetical protein
VDSGGGNNDMEEMNKYTTISLKKSDGGNDRKEESWQRGRGRRQHNGQRQHNNKDHNSNTTIKQCTGERGANNDGGDWQLAVGNVDEDRQQWRQALEGEDDGGGLGQRFGRGGGEWLKERQRTRAAEDSSRPGGVVGCEKCLGTIILHCVKPQQRKLFCVGKEGQTLRYIIR